MWLFEILFDLIGGGAADAAVRRMPAWGCALCSVLLVAGLILLLILIG
jgi:hypothetical protein